MESVDREAVKARRDQELEILKGLAKGGEIDYRGINRAA